MFASTILFEPGRSRPERSFVQQAARSLRLDGRRAGEWRDVKLSFGADWGTAAVVLGATQVLAKVSCDIGPPTTGRPNEGRLLLNASLGGVAFLDEGQVLHDQRFLALNSLLERTFRSSRCLELESLCVAAEQHVWCIRVDVSVLNHDGNLYDASTIATLAALMHFRRPDVTFSDDVLRTYSEMERDLVPLLFLHFPVSVTYCIYKSSPQPLVDPTILEENAADSVIVLSFNSYKELCTLNAGGTAPTNAQTIMQCARNAAARSQAVVTFIRKALELDEEFRMQGNPPSPVTLLGERSLKLSFRKLMEKPNDRKKEAHQKNVHMKVEPNRYNSFKVEQELKSQSKPKTDSAVDIGSWIPQDDSAQEPSTPKTPKSKQRRNKTSVKKKAQKKQQKLNESDSEEDAKPII